ncbi:hypothetical protein CANCADRAFT_110672 [Tortispora caseinolytica NRRL Y-17796]|uniref:Maintenance of telomere capping protein 1 n=1 Tax=Tortispora caseinolytica NRRL Y-17796 TaxID=767744 RepID=A0A1E4TG73_9ASCO|nr:hypothetical protein CANCADRAFT_110672 [Tortispora caseinolytica NRRL Y-17796]
MADDDVMQMLDSIDAAKKPPRGSNRYRIRRDPAKKPDEKELLGFFDSLASGRPSTDSGSRSPQTAAAAESPAQSAQLASAESLSKSQASIPAASAIPPAARITPSQTPPTSVAPASPSPAVAPTKSNTASAPEEPKSEETELNSQSGWLGSSLWNSAMSVVKSAEAAVGKHPDQIISQIEQNVRSNVDLVGSQFKHLSLNAKSTDFSKSLAEGFTKVLSTIAPPIRGHEQLRVHLLNDLSGYGNIEAVVYTVFDRVMEQVEGGELVIQKGLTSGRRNSSLGPRQLNLCEQGIEAGKKLARASIDALINSDKSKAEDKLDSTTDHNLPVHKSNIYLSIQPTVMDPPYEESFCFIAYLYDPANEIETSFISQPLPLQWARWLESSTPIIEGVDAEQWFSEWIEEALGLVLGVTAQSYVSTRMGLGVYENSSGENDQENVESTD